MSVPPTPVSIPDMHSFSVLTPFYKEDVIYSADDLLKEKTESGVSDLFYLQTLYPLEWENFLQRMGKDSKTAEADRTAIIRSDKKFDAQLWATQRGQTLHRTVSGMSHYHEAVRALARLQQPHGDSAVHLQLANEKFSYVVACQVYGEFKKTGDRKKGEGGGGEV